MESVGTPFEYIPLSTDPSGFEFRLLVVHGASYATEPLVCDLETEVLETAAPYDCISYVWGEGAPSKLISLNGFEVLIGENLWNALKKLRGEKTRRLWVDAICVNQKNTEERTSQVSKMRDLYAGAAEVAVWLGERGDFGRGPRKNAKRLEEFLKYLKEGAKTLSLTFSFVDTTKPFKPSIFKVISSAELEKLKREIDNCSDWFYSPWWMRIWVLQEASVSRRHPLFHFGDEKTSWEIFNHLRKVLPGLIRSERALRKASHSFRQIWPSPKFKLLSEFIDATFGQLESIRSKYQNHSHLSLKYLYEKSWRRMCTDPRDRYYVLLGLTSPPCQIKADYETPVDKLRRLYDKHNSFPDCTHDELLALLRKDEERRDRKNEARRAERAADPLLFTKEDEEIHRGIRGVARSSFLRRPLRG
ncbi:hypothetical protein IFR05_007534 [Cadophora sp. M221]|nr:hypothetical protein IFR05_007534 [Cadophora sp. M221]